MHIPRNSSQRSQGANGPSEIVVNQSRSRPVRRRFYELAAAGPAPIANEALRRIAELYRIEDDIRGRPANERRATRQARSGPIVADLEPWLREKLGLISQKTKLADAIRTVSGVAITPWRDNSREAAHRSGSVYGR
ncbi:hypothetical protein BG36_09590 [Aquamicrobium defluvii]|uniref:Transposase IS66 central domain-containing protein n=1 Tax=Aquamicrobium defluvii TaxID=69279 RepID=A0A011T036_9HYPH|nr:hypothetical protein BG36_09590 [Aquamicrobium defluvii]EZQ14563.1 hypothetical protein CF98_18985 [Halopseudomonas bauzanensis]